MSSRPINGEFSTYMDNRDAMRLGWMMLRGGFIGWLTRKPRIFISSHWSGPR